MATDRPRTAWTQLSGRIMRTGLGGILVVATVTGCTTSPSPDGVGQATQSTSAPGTSSQTRRGTTPGWRPRAGTTWQVQYSGPVDLTVRAAAYDLDWEDTSAAQVAAIRRRGGHAICYVNAGAWEDWRSDSGAIAPAARGRPMDGWSGERWLDVRRLDVLLPVMKRRMDVCRSKGFEAVDPDNLDGYDNRTGFPLTARDSVTYQRALARVARERGLSIGLKNAVEILPEVTPDVDFAVNESCLAHDECHRYAAFVGAGKAVLHIEYAGSPGTVCARRPRGFSTVIKARELTAPRVACPG